MHFLVSIDTAEGGCQDAYEDGVMVMIMMIMLMLLLLLMSRHFLAGVELSGGENMRAMYGVLACLATLKSTKGGKMLLESDKHLEDITVKALAAKYRRSSSPELKEVMEQGVNLLLH